MIRVLLVFLVASFSLSCSGMQIDHFAAAQPTFVLEEYFAGNTKAWGIVVDRWGSLRRQFQVDIEGRQEGDELVLYERFLYSDGEEQQRVWRIKKTEDGRYIGRADDVIGEAEGVASGNALNWRYTLELPIGDSLYHVAFDDWMFLQQEQVLINRAEMRKWGFRLGEVILFFTKPRDKLGD